VNTFGGFYCECEPGHMRNGSLCIGIFFIYLFIYLFIFLFFIYFYFLFFV